ADKRTCNTCCHQYRRQYADHCCSLITHNTPTTIYQQSYHNLSTITITITATQIATLAPPSHTTGLSPIHASSRATKNSATSPPSITSSMLIAHRQISATRIPFGP